MDRVLYGLRSLRDGQTRSPTQPDLPADDHKLRMVASDLATRLVTAGLVAPESVSEALEAEDHHAAETRTGVEQPGDAPARTDVPASHRGRADVQVGDPAIVMVVHGQDADAQKALFNWLRSVGLRPQEWSQLVAASGSASPFIGDVLESAFAAAQAVVVLFTPDEQARLRPLLAAKDPQWRLQARPNVLFEAGRAFGSHPERTILVVLGEQALPTDLAGRHYVRISSVESLRDLANRLERAGCPVDISGSDWLDIDRFPDRTDVEAAPSVAPGNGSN